MSEEFISMDSIIFDNIISDHNLIPNTNNHNINLNINNSLISDPIEELYHNHIFKIDKNIQKQCINYLRSNIIIDESYTNDMIKIVEDVLTKKSVSYSSEYLRDFINIFNKFYSAYTHLKYEMKLSDISNNINNSNNEDILIHHLLCFKFLIKILSNNLNEYDCVMSEYNMSKFITENIVLNDESPHFQILVSFINIGYNLGKYSYDTENNYGLIYHYIQPWSIFIKSQSIEIDDLNKLLQVLYTNRYNLTQEYIYDILESVIFQVIYSLIVLSKYNISHNDLRPHNIMIQGGYETNSNMFDHYQINNGSETFDFYLRNMGFKIKIIDFGLCSSDTIPNLMCPKSKDHILVYDAGIFAPYSDYYDIHYFVNDILNRNIISKMCPKINQLLLQIVNSKYIGTDSNKYLNKYWRLSFPYTIKYFIPKYPDIFNHINLKYTPDNKLIVNQDLISAFRVFFQTYVDKTIPQKIFNMIVDPLDNNPHHILKPYDAIKLFTNQKVKPYSELQISNKYVVNFV